MWGMPRLDWGRTFIVRRPTPTTLITPSRPANSWTVGETTSRVVLTRGMQHPRITNCITWLHLIEKRRVVIGQNLKVWGAVGVYSFISWQGTVSKQVRIGDVWLVYDNQVPRGDSVIEDLVEVDSLSLGKWKLRWTPDLELFISRLFGVGEISYKVRSCPNWKSLLFFFLKLSY